MGMTLFVLLSAEEAMGRVSTEKTPYPSQLLKTISYKNIRATMGMTLFVPRSAGEAMGRVGTEKTPYPGQHFETARGAPLGAHQVDKGHTISGARLAQGNISVKHTREYCKHPST